MFSHKTIDLAPPNALQGYAHIYAGWNLALNFTKILLFNSTVMFYARCLLAEIWPKSFKWIKFIIVFEIKGAEKLPPRPSVHENVDREETRFLFLHICYEVKSVIKIFLIRFDTSLIAFNKLILKGFWEILKKPSFCPWKCLPVKFRKSPELSVFSLFLHLVLKVYILMCIRVK